MVYFLKFLIIYLLYANVCGDTDDFDDYDSENYGNSARNVYLNLRQINSQPIFIPEHFIGSNLMGSGTFAKQCFSVEDVALLATRSKFEALIPSVSTVTLRLEDDKSVENMLEYFYGFNQLLNMIEKEDLKFFSQQAFYDVVGGYFNYFYWPLVKYSFYAGMLTYNSTISVYSLHRHCKETLNTIGNGWRQSKDFSQTNFKIEPINSSTKIKQDSEAIIPADGRDNACEKLLLASDEDATNRFATDLIVSLPQIEADDGILNVRLPFKRKQNYNFNSKASAFVLLKYYVTVCKCYGFRKQSTERFDVQFSKLVKEKFLPLLQRDKFYPGFGAILRISESLSHRSIVSRNIENSSNGTDVQQVASNRTVGNADDILNDEGVHMSPQNESSFFEQVVHFVNMDDDWDESKKIEIIFLISIAAVLSVAFLILCCCLIMKSRSKSRSTERQMDEKASEGSTSFFHRFRKKTMKKKETGIVTTTSDSNIGPRSSSILVGNDFDDTESRVSTQTKSSGLSLKDLIHAEISKRPTRPSKQQIKALSRNSKKLKTAKMTDMLEHS